MARFEDIVQLKAFARQDGAILALLWIASFACTVLSPDNGLGSLLAIATPFLVGWRLCAFRNYALDGRISFRRAYAYCFYTFLYASLIFAIAQYLYFKFLDHGAFAINLVSTINQMAPMYRDAGMTEADLKLYTDTIQSLAPINWSLMFLVQDVTIGIVAGLPIAAICKRQYRTIQ